MKQELFIARFKLTKFYKNSENWKDYTYMDIDQHGNYLRNLGKEGKLLFAGRTLMDTDDEDLFGIAVFISSSFEEANEIFKNDPAIKKSIQEVNIFPFSLGIQYFENLNYLS